jgi:hypothetical protein
MLPGNNPYMIRDINTIIDVFVDPIEPGKTAGTTIRDTITNVPSWLKTQGGDGSVAALSNRLQEQLDQAKGAIDALYSYGTTTSPRESLDIPGIEGITFNNTASTILNADNTGDALKALVADCVPCKDRIIALLGINPIEDAWNHFNRMYQNSISFLLDLYDMFLGDHSVEVFQDFCSLFNFLSFMCLPDLASIIMLLSRLITKYSVALADVQITFMSIMSKISGPALAPLMATVDKYIQLIVAPIECVIAALDAQLQKIDVVQSWEKNVNGDQTAERTFSMKEIAGPLQGLKKYLLDSVNEVKKEFEKLDKSMQDLLGMQEQLNGHMFDLSKHIQMCARFVGLVQAIIFALSQGSIKCGPGQTNDWNNEEDLRNFVSNNLGQAMDVSITLRDDQAVISPRVPTEIGNLLQTLAVYEKELPTLTTPRPASEAPLPVAEATITFKNCLYTVKDSELDKLKDFLGSF